MVLKCVCVRLFGLLFVFLTWLLELNIFDSLWLTDGWMDGWRGYVNDMKNSARYPFFENIYEGGRQGKARKEWMGDFFSNGMVWVCGGGNGWVLIFFFFLYDGGFES